MESQTTTTTTTHTTTVSMNVNYVTSPLGILRICEMVLGLICWAIVASIPWLNHSPPWQFVMFVAVTSWIMTVILFIIYVGAFHASICSGLPWAIIELLFNGFWAVFYFIAACVAAAYTNGWSLLVAATVFAWFTTICYVVHAAFAFKEYRGGSFSGSSVNT
ncbi:MARVEL domain-containing protein 1 [Ciona intestinalis]